MSRLIAPLAVAATLFMGALAAAPFAACTDGTTPDCSGDGGECGYAVPDSGPSDAPPAPDSAPAEASTPEDSAPPAEAAAPDSAPPADAPTD